MWCSKCQQSYVVSEAEVRQYRCPLHDHGAPSLGADDPNVEWVSR
jgi:hypothetical protein